MFPQLPDYEILRLIGRDELDLVTYQARDLRLNRVVVLKTWPPDAYEADVARQSLTQEAAILRVVRHPHIIHCFGAFEREDHVFLKLEFLSGRLRQRQKDGPLPAREAAQLVEQLAGALQALHKAGFVHRNMKPDQVLYGHDGTPKLADFGLACELNQHMPKKGVIVGTPLYMAPEQLAGSAATASFDIHGLGVVLYELVTGRPPWKIGTIKDWFDQIMNAIPVPPRSIEPSVPTELEDICLKCLEKKPEQRYPSAKALAADLHRFLQGSAKRSLFGRIFQWRS